MFLGNLNILFGKKNNYPRGGQDNAERNNYQMRHHRTIKYRELHYLQRAGEFNRKGEMMINKISKDLYLEEFERQFAPLSDDVRRNRYMTSQALRLTMDQWCRKTFASEYDVIKENKIFIGHMKDRFNEALDEYVG